MAKFDLNGNIYVFLLAKDKDYTYLYLCSFDYYNDLLYK